MQEWCPSALAGRVSTAPDRPPEWDRMSHHARNRWLRRHGLHPNGRPIRSRPAPAPPPSPDGACLTGMWDSLSPGEKARWLAVVEAEAAAVRAEAAQRRADQESRDDVVAGIAAEAMSLICRLDPGLAQGPEWRAVIDAVREHNRARAADMRRVRLRWRVIRRVRAYLKQARPGSGIHWTGPVAGPFS